MRPHRLAVQAFGPFPDAHEVDFDALGAAGLLLLHGETGAGKTSLLDAIGFALYGEVPGARGVRGLRSEHAPPAVETSVRLEFSAGGHRWRVTRTPRQQTAKQRGDGLTVRQPTALLEQRTGAGWLPVATRLDEVGQCVTDAVGLSGAQFFQVVLLPQGGFAAFLHASADARQALLQQLFGTERFAEVERLLRERRAELGQQVTAVRQRVDALVGALQPVLGPPSSGAADGAWVRAHVAGLTAALEGAETAQEAAREAEAEAADALLDAERLAARQQRRATLEARAGALAAEEPRVAAARAELAAARAAGPVRPLLDQLSGRRAEADTAARAVTDAVAGLGRLGLGSDVGPSAELDPEAGRAAAAAAERALRDEVATLRGVLPLEEQLTAAQDEQRRLAEVMRAADARLAGAVESRAAAEARQASAGDARAAVEALAAQLPGRRDAVAALEARLDAVRALPGAEATVAAARSGLVTAREAAVAARERWVRLAERRLAGMAGELAAGLTDGVPCLVCGSPEHPHPAPQAGEPVTEATAKAARAAADDAEAAVEPLRVEVERAAAEAARLTALAGGAGVDQAALVAPLAVTRVELSAAEGAAARLAVVVAEADGARAGLAEAVQAVDDAQAALAAAVRAYEAARGSAEEQAARVAAARGADASVAARLRRLQAAADAQASYGGALQQLGQTGQALARAAADAATAAARSGFPDVEAAAAAVRDDGRLVALADDVARHDGEARSVAAGLAEPELQSLPDQPAAVAAARAAREAARAELETATARRTRLAEQAHRAAELATALERAERELAPLLAEHEQVSALTELAVGGAGNRLKMSLTAFVLAARLEAVAARASVRLAHMTSGRYTLVHSDQLYDGRQRSGLGLAVRDVWTGTERPTSSLSGGETFMTALALALGLSDVVAEEAGGRRIDALFIDEGFGTLDEGALERVIDVLDELRDGGRLVGLVSHVPELQRRVPARLEVIRGEAGSRLRAHAVPVD